MPWPIKWFEMTQECDQSVKKLGRPIALEASLKWQEVWMVMGEVPGLIMCNSKNKNKGKKMLARPI